MSILSLLVTLLCVSTIGAEEGDQTQKKRGISSGGWIGIQNLDTNSLNQQWAISTHNQLPTLPSAPQLPLSGPAPGGWNAGQGLALTGSASSSNTSPAKEFTGYARGPASAPLAYLPGPARESAITEKVVEKLVAVPVERIVHKPYPVAVPIPQTVPVAVEQLIPIPVKTPIAIPVHHAFPIPIKHTVPVPIPVPVPVHDHFSLGSVYGHGGLGLGGLGHGGLGLGGLGQGGYGHGGYGQIGYGHGGYGQSGYGGLGQGLYGHGIGQGIGQGTGQGLGQGLYGHGSAQVGYGNGWNQGWSQDKKKRSKD